MVINSRSTTDISFSPCSDKIRLREKEREKERVIVCERESYREKRVRENNREKSEKKRENMRQK